ncbi:MAG: hypothetical protein AB1425_15425 [Actinomycetota bacterium]
MARTLREGKSAGSLAGLWRAAVRLSVLAAVPGGALWALSPLGVRLSEMKFKTPNVFWKLFPSAPLLILIGLVGLRLRASDRLGWLGRAGFWVAVAGIVLVVAGDVGKFWLELDNVYIMTAPAYRSLRLGLVLFAAGSLAFGVDAARKEALPVWGALPFSVGALAGFIAVLQDLGSFGAGLWISFGVAWLWLGLSVLVGDAASFWRARRAKKT